MCAFHWNFLLFFNNTFRSLFTFAFNLYIYFFTTVQSSHILEFVMAFKVIQSYSPVKWVYLTWYKALDRRNILTTAPTTIFAVNPTWCLQYLLLLTYKYWLTRLKLFWFHYIINNFSTVLLPIGATYHLYKNKSTFLWPHIYFFFHCYCHCHWKKGKTTFR